MRDDDKVIPLSIVPVQREGEAESGGREQVIEEDVLKRMEEIIALARKGVVTELIMIGYHAEEDGYFNIAQYVDVWRFFGALENAKAVAARSR